MNDQSRCLVRAITGPIILITVGTLFALEKFTPYRFVQTWPVLLIVIGLLKLAGGRRRPRRWAAQATINSRPAPNPFPPIPPQPPRGGSWDRPANAPPPPYSNPNEPMPDMTPPPPPRPGERR